MSDGIKLHDGKEELLGVIKMDEENMSWEELDKEYAQNVGTAIELQKDIVKLVTENSAKIDADKELFQVSSGLIKSIKDVVTEYVETRKLYHDKIGTDIDTSDNDTIATYLTVKQNFVESSEKFANLTLIAVTDVIIRLTDNNKEIVDMACDAVNFVENEGK